MIFGIFLFLLTAVEAPAQSEAELRRAFEGKFVRVKIDMPGTKDGVDFHWRREPPIDFQSYSRRIKNHAIALRSGDRVIITTVKVKPKNVEFHLGGGGFGTFGDNKPSAYVPTVSKSRAESDLEKEIKNETDSRRKDRLRSDLSRMQRDRRYAEQQREARVRELEILAREETQRREREGGSRINLWFPEGVLKESVPTPRELASLLAEYVEFDAEAPGSLPAARPSSGLVPAQSSPAGELRRGMTLDDAYRILGRPAESAKGKQGSLDTVTETWDLSDRTVEAVFVDGLLLKFSVSSK